jgi:hypothetical protein
MKRKNKIIVKPLIGLEGGGIDKSIEYVSKNPKLKFLREKYDKVKKLNIVQGNFSFENFKKLKTYIKQLSNSIDSKPSQTTKNKLDDANTQLEVLIKNFEKQENLLAKRDKKKKDNENYEFKAKDSISKIQSAIRNKAKYKASKQSEVIDIGPNDDINTTMNTTTNSFYSTNDKNFEPNIIYFTKKSTGEKTVMNYDYWIFTSEKI